MLEIKRKPKEPLEAMIRRWKKRLQQSRTLYLVKEGQYFKRAKNKRTIRLDAQRREHIREHKEYLRRIGKLEK